MASSKLWWGLFGGTLATAVGILVACAPESTDTTPEAARAPPPRPERLARIDLPTPPPEVKPVPVPAPPKFEKLSGVHEGRVGRKAASGAAPVQLSVGSEAYVGDGSGVAGPGALGSGRGGGGAMAYGSGGAAAYGMADSISVGHGYARMRGGAADDEPRTGEGYHNYGVNPFVTAAEDPLSTFAVDVDTASYTIARRKILEGQLPPPDAVRVEEFLNYFRYDLPAPAKEPFAVHVDAAPNPFEHGRRLLRVALQGRRLPMSERKPTHLVFLVDVSGSMQSPDKLPLAKKALRILVDNLRDGDTVALVTYAGGVRDVLPPTDLAKKAEIHAAIESLEAGGSTAMNDGLALAYRHAARTLSPDSTSRVIVLSDGDANVGPTSREELLRTISGHVKEGVTLSVCGFGMGNYKDDVMEQLADKGNGNYFYVDSLMQARRVFQEQLGGTLEVIAQDVKVQVEFDPAVVRKYRLVGYENRDVADRDFRNDKVDAGEIGSGHSVTAMYELELADGAEGRGLGTVRVRAKKPRGVNADEWSFPIGPERLAKTFPEASPDLRFAAAVMGAAEIFRRSPVAAQWNLGQVEAIARGATPPGNAEREEFVHLLEKAKAVVGPMATR